MGDISRHRDIYLNTREAIPASLLAKCQISADDLTYLEMGNYLTDVSQFRDPVTYIFAKQKIWREKILPGVASSKAVVALQALTALAAIAGAAALANAGKGKLAALPLAALPLQGLLSDRLHDALAGVKGLDDWIDRMFGNPVEQLGPDGKRKPEQYGYVGQFFEHFIEGITHLLFAQEIKEKVKGNWGKVGRIPEKSLAAVYKDFFTQYFPHEHTDQPPYVWDASKRPAHREYQPSTRQKSLANKSGGIMSIVDDDYLRYLSEELSKLEDEGRRFKANDVDARRTWLVRMGKILHGIEDWFFHSNIVELIRLSSYRSKHRDEPDSDAFAQRFVEEELKNEPEFLTADRAIQTELKRKFYRRLRFAEYDRGTKTNSAGTPNKEKSTLSLHHAYPAFPSQQDTAHTLLGALENLERKGKDRSGKMPTEWPPWVPCVLQKFQNAGPEWQKVVDDKAKASGLTKANLDSLSKSTIGSIEERMQRFVGDVLREWVPLVVTLLSESERQRLVANVDPLQWPTDKPPQPGIVPGSGEVDKQLDRHRVALEPKMDAQGYKESNYARTARYMVECGFLNATGQQALNKAFEVDRKSEAMNDVTPGAGGFLIQFAVDLQRTLDEAEAVTERLNKKENATYQPPTDNGSFNEIIGSHSLMSKDTTESLPFFDDAKVLASVASQAVFHIMLEEISAPGADRLYWQKILQFFIRFPEPSEGWERRVLAFFKHKKNQGKIPKYADLPELAQLKTARLPAKAIDPWIKGTKRSELEQRYVKLEKELSRYRYPQ